MSLEWKMVCGSSIDSKLRLPRDIKTVSIQLLRSNSRIQKKIDG